MGEMLDKFFYGFDKAVYLFFLEVSKCLYDRSS